MQEGLGRTRKYTDQTGFFYSNERVFRGYVQALPHGRQSYPNLKGHLPVCQNQLLLRVNRSCEFFCVYVCVCEEITMVVEL